LALEAAAFDAVCQRLKAAGSPCGDRPGTVGSMQGPGLTPGARGLGKAVSFHDPSGHVLESKPA
jgi:catechol 2,3-dioxygenase-like lactoylglutathione lyase family enzyme